MGGHCEPPSSPSPSSSSSSRDSNSHTALSTTSSPVFRQRRDLSTDLKLGLSLSTFSPQDNFAKEREQLSNCPSIKPLLRSTLEITKVHQGNPGRFFVKVYMEGVPIGRKLDLFAHNGYDNLVKTLGCMFRVTIMCPDFNQVPSGKTHVLTYEDIEGDWMMVGDVPWEFFLATVKKLKITSFDRC